MNTEPSEEEFEAWQDHPVTRWVLDAYAKLAIEQKRAWMLVSWESGAADPAYLIELRTRADAYSSMAETSLGDLIATHEAEIPDASL